MRKAAREAKDRTGAMARWIGLGAVVVLAVASLVEPTAATPTGPALDGLRRADRFQSRYPAFRGAQPTPMGVFDANGASMEISFFRVEAAASVVLDFYAGELARGNRHVDRQENERQGTVSCFDETVGALVAVHVFSASSRAHDTLVFTSVVDGPEGLQLSMEPPADLPHPEGAVTALRIDEARGGRASSTVTQVVQGPTGEVAAAYRSQLMSGGWKPVEERTTRDIQMLEFARGAEHLSLSVSPLATTGTPESAVTLIRETRARPVETRP
ncbi:MAG: hypothetical protein HY901_16320 [Deltaproteobacteria bacterium]|nr:hypothetical protein [Deltaproteobacteria bacterium]